MLFTVVEACFSIHRSSFAIIGHTVAIQNSGDLKFIVTYDYVTNCTSTLTPIDSVHCRLAMSDMKYYLHSGCVHLDLLVLQLNEK